MFKFFGEALKITNNNIILATPLILFMLLISVYKFFVAGVASTPVLILGLVTYFLMWTAFLSGWFYIIRQAILINYEDISKEEKLKKSFGLISLMVKGVGEYFSSFLGLMVMALILFGIFVYIIYFAGIHLIGHLNIPFNDLVSASTAQVSTEDFMKNTPHVELLKLVKWGYLAICSFAVYFYMMLFWSVAVLKNSKNIFKALVISNKFLVRNFFNTVLFLIILSFLYFIVMLGCGILLQNSILAYFSLLIYFYFIVYIMVLVFLFYEKFEEKSFSRCGSDSIGQDNVCDKSGEED